MNKILPLILVGTLSISNFSNAQDIKIDQEKIKKEAVDNSCECFHKINHSKLLNRKELYDKIKTCIDEQIFTFQMSDKINTIPINTDKTKEKKEIIINIDTNETGPEYLKYYRIIESELFENCTDFRQIISSSEIGLENEIPSENKKALNYYNKGIEAVKKNDSKSAIDLFSKAVKEDPKFYYAWDNLGINYRRLEQYDEAINAYQKSLQINPYGTMPLQNIAVAYIHQKNYNKALDAYQKFADIYPDNPETFYGIGHLYIANLQNYEKGLDYMCKAYNKYIENNSPYRSDAETMIGLAFKEMKAKNQESLFYKILENNNIKIGK